MWFGKNGGTIELWGIKHEKNKGKKRQKTN